MKTFRNTCKGNENRLDEGQPVCGQTHMVVLGILWSLHVLCQAGTDHPKQLHGKIMKANRTFKNAFFLSLQESANAMNIGYSFSLYRVSFVPLLSLKEWRNGKEKLQSAKEEPESQICEHGT